MRLGLKFWLHWHLDGLGYLENIIKMDQNGKKNRELWGAQKTGFDPFFGCCMLRTLMVNVLHCHTFRFYNAAWPSRPKHFILRKSHIDRTLMHGLETTLYIDCQILILFLPVVLFDFAALVSNPTTCCDNCLFFFIKSLFITVRSP